MIANVLMDEMTSTDVHAAIAAGFTTAVVACGAVEQHGPHLPLLMDAGHGAELAVQVARRLGNALVAPTIRVGCSDHHMAFAGTISLQRGTFQAVCMDYTMSLARHGFRAICFVPTHGGNFAPLGEVMPELNGAVGPATRVYAFLDLPAQIELWRRVIQDACGLGSRVGGHADIAEASIMMAIRPDLVHEDRAVPGYMGDLTPDVLRTLFAQGIHAISPNGILGDPRGMSAALGAACIAATADMMADYFAAVRREADVASSG